MIIDVIILNCKVCDATWDMDRDPGQCSCDSPLGDEPDDSLELFVVTLAGDIGQPFTANSKVDGVEITIAADGDLSNVINAWIAKFRTARGVGLA